ncbi:PAS domain S-box protein [Polluticoccus soli]|uniref:response regulator n=1 Tax=Polluticoccus soli TaxID=3034150 RepID=UPI0023E22A30|nr:PAS domain S-box protein [Flavipsychrobacter sp. JY13-12]
MTNEKIVIIEDNDDTYFLFRNLLKTMGYDEQKVIRCAQLHELEKIDPKEVSVVLTDLSLPDSPYRLTFKKVNDHFVYNPIIVLTGTSETEVANNILKAGAQDYLIKGEIDARVLAKSIQYAIERKRMANDYKRLFLESPVPMYIFEKDTHRFLAVNEAALRQYQYTKNEFLAMTALDIRPESEWERFYKVRQSMPDSYFDAGRWLHQRKDGKQFYVHVHAHGIEFEGKEATIVLAYDVDDHVKAERELQEKTTQIEKILGSVGDGFLTIDKDWKFTYVNPAAERMLRRKRSEMLGNNVWECFPEANGTKLQECLQQAADTKRSVHFEDYFQTLELWIEVNAYPSEDGLTVFFIDTSAQKHNEGTIEKQSEQLREIAWVQSHKVRNHITTIQGLTALFNAADPADPVNATVINGINETIKKLDEAVKDINHKAQDSAPGKTD